MGATVFLSIPSFKGLILRARIMRHEHGVGRGYNTSMDTTTGLTLFVERINGWLLAVRCSMPSDIRPGQSVSVHESAFLSSAGDRQPSFD